MTKNNKNNVELTIKPDKDTEVKINITETLEDLGLTTEKTDDATLLNKLGASVGVNSCSYVKIPKGGD
ncbi:hypothetical protein [Lactobacillus johnsonii]|uniref:Uncharacterized protein n=1 Tax=Lactobacillus johnsonii TaxID=33959 RepID=A0A256MFT7_LACJH|nr:hypothetical protein [Lactobacillus johnsonii]MBZ4027194.1 hypothetical protein [Lactobacillus johnsonii]MBZ4029185.1 hypothetical protein [Lactobacillus johnsonii]OYS04287.1 hypothetical protein CBF54_05080 [Lactobacillus johnsonii]OYS05645.1 hypothetical protein CBF62_08095 [Lactobacillus johnsonii]OYS09134.1 hypothetical protein CBF65_05050 [Lactobacillus johnsonii]